MRLLTAVAIVLGVTSTPVGLAGQAPGADSGLQLLGDFSPDWRDTWELQQLGGGSTSYRAVRQDGGTVLQVESDGAATALYRRIDVTAGEASLTWRWKVERSLSHGNEKERRGDDYAARMFVIFGPEILSRSTRALCYVWAGSEALNSRYRSPFVDEVQTIVLQSGDANARVWMNEAPDVAGDYRRAFGEEPVAISAIAIMVDTDNTGSRAVAWFDDLVVGSQR